MYNSLGSRSTCCAPQESSSDGHNKLVAAGGVKEMAGRRVISDSAGSSRLPVLPRTRLRGVGRCRGVGGDLVGADAVVRGDAAPLGGAPGGVVPPVGPGVLAEQRGVVGEGLEVPPADVQGVALPPLG